MLTHTNLAFKFFSHSSVKSFRHVILFVKINNKYFIRKFKLASQTKHFFNINVNHGYYSSTPSVKRDKVKKVDTKKELITCP